MRVKGIRMGGKYLAGGVKLQDLTSEKLLELEVLLGPPPRLYTFDGSPQKTTNMKLRSLEYSGKFGDRQNISGGEHRKSELMSSFSMGSKELNELDHIPKNPSATARRYQNLVNAVDSEDLHDVFKELSKLGPNPARLSNILVEANLSTIPNARSGLPFHQNRHYVGDATRDYWIQDGQKVVLEKRLMSLLNLAWRRRYYFISYTLLKYDQYAKSGVLIYLGHEHDLLKKEVKKSLDDAALSTPALHALIYGYMEPLYPPRFDAGTHPEGYDRDMNSDLFKGDAFNTRSTLYESVVYDLAFTSAVLEDGQNRILLGAQLTELGNPFQPYH